MFWRRVTLLLGAGALVVACAAPTSEGEPATEAGTIPVGELPPTFAVDTTERSVGSSVPRTTTPIPPDAQVGKLVDGNRVILIGDSVLASTSRRYGNNMCQALVPLGWQVEVDAETGRFVEFGHDVLDDRLSAGWDVGVILLGNNYRGDREQYREQLEGLVERLSPGPVVLLTVSEFTESRIEVNEVIFDVAAEHENVLIVDWAVTTAADDTLTGADGLHLTETGRDALAAEVALALGEAPVGPGDCLTTSFQDDSAGSVDGGSATPTTVRRPSAPSTTTGQSGGGTTATTVPPTVAPTPAPTEPPPPPPTEPPPPEPSV